MATEQARWYVIHTYSGYEAMVKDSLEVGGAGVAFGRNLFQAKNPGKITRAISEVVHHDLEVEEALKFLE